ncbi:MAG: ABC transporter substrate-binding protein [Deltaproteobacteria bacterium]|nr:ABC transporter substrate-binding protein [Deltaproteobacteria bacterium]
MVSSISCLCYEVEAFDRIISLKPNITEILFELGVGDKIVGATTWCDNPPAAKKIPRVADYLQVDGEKALALSPDLVIGSKENSAKGDIDFLSRQGIPVKLFSFNRLEETFKSLLEIAGLVGKEERGKELVEALRKGFKTMHPLSEAPSPRVLMVVGLKPLVVVGGNNLLDDLLEIVGGKNIAGNSLLRYPNYGIDQLISARPEVIVDLTMGNETGGKEKKMDWYRQFRSVPAVKNGRIYFLDIADFRASKRLLVGARKLHEVLNPPPPPFDKGGPGGI